MLRSLIGWCVPERALRFREPITRPAPTSLSAALSLAVVRESDELAHLQRHLYLAAGAQDRS